MLSARPLRSTIITRFSATMGLSDSRPMSPHGYLFPQCAGRVAASTPPGLPGSSTNLSLRAVPNHPGKPGDVMLPLYSLTGGRLHHLRQAGRLPTHVTRPNRVHFRYGSQVRFARLRLTGLLRCSLAQLHVERVIHMVDSFHSTRFASFTGAPKRVRQIMWGGQSWLQPPFEAALRN